MDFEHFALARDFFYLAVLLLGAGTGCLLNRFRNKASTGFRNSTVTIGLCFFSGAFAALTASLIFSNWMIFRETELYLLIAIAFVLAILVFRFPRAAGFPIFLVSGVCVIWIGFNFLRFPVIDAAAYLRITREAPDLIHIYPAPRNETRTAEVDFYFQPAEDNTVLEFRGFYLASSREIPLVGGVSRGAIAEIRGNNEILYTDSRLPPEKNTKFAGIRGKLLYFREISGELAIKNLAFGADLSLFFDDKALTFR